MQRWALLDDEAEHEVANETNADDDQIEDDVEYAEKKRINTISSVQECEMCGWCLISLFSF